MVTSILLFFLGAAIGSFINVLSLRYDPERPIFGRHATGGRSHCPNCKKELRWFELIPLLSFMLQLGRCRSCGVRLSLQYPIVEFLGGVIAVSMPIVIAHVFDVNLHRIGGALPTWYYLLTLVFTLAGFIYLFLSAVDLRLTLIPDQSNILIAILGIAAITLIAYAGLWSDTSGSFLKHYAALFGFRGNIWLNHVFAAFAGAVFFGAIFFLSRGRAMGFGDVKLAFASGLLLGWPDAIVALALAFIVGAVCGIILMVRRMKGMGSSIPFGPFIAIGVGLVVMLGGPLMNFYFSLFP